MRQWHVRNRLNLRYLVASTYWIKPPIGEFVLSLTEAPVIPTDLIEQTETNARNERRTNDPTGDLFHGFDRDVHGIHIGCSNARRLTGSHEPLRGVTIVIVEHSTESLAPPDLTGASRVRKIRH